MKKSKNLFFIVSLNKIFLPLTFLAFIICLIFFSNSNIIAVKKGLNLWVNSVLPSLFPFFVATELLSYTPIINWFGKILTPIMKPLFNVCGEGAFPFFMGIISGYPMGAKIITEFREKGICSIEECERLLSFTNNSGPLFILGTIGITLYNNSQIGILLFATHILACITVGFIFRFWKCKSSQPLSTNNKQKVQNSSHPTCSISNLGEILTLSITSAIKTIILIGGFIVLFSVVISILKQSRFLITFANILKPINIILNIDTKFTYGILTGILELTNGLAIITLIPSKLISTNIIICAFLLGFGGVSILLQVLSITSKSDISFKPYIIGKLLQGIFAAFYTFLILKYIPLFNINF